MRSAGLHAAPNLPAAFAGTSHAALRAHSAAHVAGWPPPFKRDRDLDLGELRTRFGAPEALLGWLAGQTGIAPDATPRSAEQLVEHFSWDVIRTHRENITVTVE